MTASGSTRRGNVLEFLMIMSDSKILLTYNRNYNIVTPRGKERVSGGSLAVLLVVSQEPRSLLHCGSINP